MKDERDLSELIEIIPDAALVVNQQGIIVLVNQLAASMFQYPHNELLGSQLDNLLPEGIRAQHKSHVGQFFNSQKNRPMGRGFRFLGQRKNGDTFHVDIMLSHVTVKSESFAIAFIRDASQNRETEEKIRRQLELERQQALTDFLTGVGNRRAFYQELAADIEELKLGHHTFSVALIDLDNFKRLNDTLGHDTGDRALQAIANGICVATRGTDFVARIGGDEFASIHPGASLEDSLVILERAREQVLKVSAENDWELSVSIGICHCADADLAVRGECTVEAILRVADAAMYQGKRSGKNQITAAQLTL
ncbi:sensor domain-containing diguanylate cyclase [Pseudidiomarina terrestris]|uniref:diguanylate cyclase n=1 Tax=Pseudidiomarina terrestris TaxID=2820060 RepID=A0AAW7QVU2_9GAMM|nr:MULTISPECIES: sensor domain-containing diguanylate cyclase [unclassified Pseudidiomarina]MDN7124018.1 GGDEF domain-containing protein [Pseudidiomarina sp. 1APP75-32.1]MDN7127082.1 GGDEF domain-containing protein [Pseudidiomarina sp. 1APR75-33.1]MDN7128275.1 GGDEF domain-containing protein [Pseudidiomarina sp. 1APR75-15]MDN7135501.1 GGDEF domain-containing protein [Pseudidiomarina sp. 1ASP75-5]MDN7139002.1 GGDEF domain-containing protein [Pseudidiomarina sp. 1ASP75-14]